MVERKLLVVDDNLEFRKVFARLLRRKGFLVREANDGAEALDQVLQQPPTLVVSDCHMPHMSGEELVEALGEKYPDLPVILISGEHQSVPARAIAFFPKVGSVATLVERVGQVWDTMVGRLDASSSFGPMRTS